MLSAVSAPKNRTSVGMPFCLATSRDVRSRLDAEHRNAARDEVLQQVAVVARDLHDARLTPSPKPGAHVVDVALACSSQESEYDEKYA